MNSCLILTLYAPLEASFGTEYRLGGVPHACYNKTEHAILMAEYAEGNKCLELMVPQDVPGWYENKYIWIGLGMVFGGAAVYGVTR